MWSRNANVPYVKTGESEIDLLVVEELFSSEQFQRWLLNKVNISEKYTFIGAWKSYNGRFGECDIAAKFNVGGDKTIILIENKIYSPEQPEQAERYHKTGRFLVEKEDIDSYVTCLLSPKIYFKENSPMKNYENKISYEELLEWFKKQNYSERVSFKRMVIKNGIDRARSGYQRITDENTDRFYDYYEEIAREIYPELEYMRPKEVASGNSWFRFNPKIFPSKITIIHKGTVGYVDLQIGGTNMKEFSVNFKKKLGKNMTIHKTGKSISVRKIVPSLPNIENIDKPELYKEIILEVLDDVKLLMEWYNENII